MAQSLSCILIHVIFSTKTRLPLIGNEIKDDLHSYMANIARSYKAHMHEIGGTEDHVHLLLALPRTIALSDLIEEIKKGSSKWIKTKGPTHKNFAWQSGYGAFSIGLSNFNALQRYIQNQITHHQKITFQEEFRQFLKKYQIPYDEKYLWD